MLLFVEGRYFSHYKYWEDYKNGFYDIKSSLDDLKMVKHVLCNTKLFFKKGCEMVDNWEYISSINLSDNNINKRAWIGQLTCFYTYKISEDIVRAGWWELNRDQQIKANKTADEIYNYWKIKYYTKQLCLKLN